MKIKRNIKNDTNFIMDFILILCIVVTLISGYILWFVVPGGSGLHGVVFCNLSGYGGPGNYLTALHWPRYIWIDIHNWVSVTLFMIILLHLTIHWRWIVEISKRVRNYSINPVKKVIERYLLVIIAYILFIFECISGFILWLILPRGSYDYINMISGVGRTFWGLQRNVWADLHAWTAVIIISFIIIHLIMHWRWLMSIMKVERNSRQ